jgi:hypothetical protein
MSAAGTKRTWAVPADCVRAGPRTERIGLERRGLRFPAVSDFYVIVLELRSPFVDPGSTLFAREF